MKFTIRNLGKSWKNPKILSPRKSGEPCHIEFLVDMREGKK